ncbi:LysR family transcriptional regulator [Neotabrizicola sp. VNH66]|uniref:LysR family transcriptional regulator n=1 Tax=Neotabrizicola sp. VNH66 TaxID=3400918 RepID=UPI003C10D96D
MDWENIKYFLALARSGTLTEAARRMNVQHSTISRRISRLEIDQGEPLFLRAQDGYGLSSAGRRLLARAEAVERAVRAMEPRAPADGVSGTVRVGVTEGYGSYVIPSALRDLATAHPDLEVELIVEPRIIHLPRNEADILINIDRPERGPYLVQKLMDYDLGLFASPDYLMRAGRPGRAADLPGYRFVSYLPNTGPARGVPAISTVPEAPEAKTRSSSLNVQIALASAGVGIALLPLFAVQPEDGLERLLPEEVIVRRSYWISAPSEVRQLARVRCVWDAIVAGARSRRAAG